MKEKGGERIRGRSTIFEYFHASPPTTILTPARFLSDNSRQGASKSKIADGAMEKKYASNARVKSKSSRQPLTIGPNAESADGGHSGTTEEFIELFGFWDDLRCY